MYINLSEFATEARPQALLYSAEMRSCFCLFFYYFIFIIVIPVISGIARNMLIFSMKLANLEVPEHLYELSENGRGEFKTSSLCFVLLVRQTQREIWKQCVLCMLHTN